MPSLEGLQPQPPLCSERWRGNWPRAGVAGTLRARIQTNRETTVFQIGPLPHRRLLSVRLPQPAIQILSSRPSQLPLRILSSRLPQVPPQIPNSRLAQLAIRIPSGHHRLLPRSSQTLSPEVGLKIAVALRHRTAPRQRIRPTPRTPGVHRAVRATPPVQVCPPARQGHPAIRLPTRLCPPVLQPRPQAVFVSGNFVARRPRSWRRQCFRLAPKRSA